EGVFVAEGNDETMPAEPLLVVGDVKRGGYNLDLVVAAVDDRVLGHGEAAVDSKRRRTILEDAILSPLVAQDGIRDQGEAKLVPRHHSGRVSDGVIGKGVLVHDDDGDVMMLPGGVWDWKAVEV